jgi:hypothetical protein
MFKTLTEKLQHEFQDEKGEEPEVGIL